MAIRMNRHLKISLISVLMVVVLLTTFTLQPITESKAFVLTMPAIALGLGILALAGITYVAVTSIDVERFMENVFWRDDGVSTGAPLWWQVLYASIDQNNDLIIDADNIDDLQQAKDYVLENIDTSVPEYSYSKENIGMVTNSVNFYPNSKYVVYGSDLEGTLLSTMGLLTEFIDYGNVLDQLNDGDFFVFDNRYGFINNYYEQLIVGIEKGVTNSINGVNLSSPVNRYRVFSYKGLMKFNDVNKYVYTPDDIASLGVTLSYDTEYVYDFSELKSVYDTMAASGTFIPLNGLYTTLSGDCTIAYCGWKNSNGVVGQHMVIKPITTIVMYNGSIAKSVDDMEALTFKGHPTDGTAKGDIYMATQNYNWSHFEGVGGVRTHFEATVESGAVQITYSPNDSIDVINDGITSGKLPSVCVDIPDIPADDLTVTNGIGIDDVLPQDVLDDVNVVPPVTDDVITSGIKNWWDNTVGDFFTGIGNAIYDALQRFWQSVIDFFTAIKDGILSIPQAIDDAISEHFPAAPNTGDVKFVNIWHYVTDTLAYISGFITLILSVWAIIPTPIMTMMYAFIVIVIVLGVYRRLIE